MRDRDDLARPGVAIPHRVRPNSRSSRSQIAYAASSRSRSRNSRSRSASVGRAARPGGRPGCRRRRSPSGRHPGAGLGRRSLGASSASASAAARCASSAANPGVAARRASAARTCPASASANGARATPSSVTIARHERRGRAVEARVADRRALGRDRACRRRCRTGPGRPSSSGAAAASAVARSTAVVAHRTRNGMPAACGRERERVRARGPPTTSPFAHTRSAVDEDRVDLARGDAPGRRGIRHERVRHGRLGELPRRDAGTLEARAGPRRRARGPRGPRGAR